MTAEERKIVMGEGLDFTAKALVDMNSGATPPDVACAKLIAIQSKMLWLVYEAIEELVTIENARSK